MQMGSAVAAGLNARGHGAFAGVVAWTGVALVCAASLCAQATAVLSGTVTDQSGAVVSGATVLAKDVESGAVRGAVTDSAGHYRITSLAAGRYEIRGGKTGFVEAVRSDVPLTGGQSATVDIKMQLSAPDACASGREFAATDCALTWHGITLYGAYDVGVGWVSHGLPENARQL